MPAAELARIKAELAYERHPESAYEALAAVCFDTECIETSGFDGEPEDLNSYAKLLRHFGAATHGVFTPSAIVDVWDTDTGTARVGFDHGGRHYEVTVELQSDWFQGEVFELINHALSEQGCVERFVALPVVDQVLHAAFVDPAIVERAREVGLIPDMSRLLEEEMGISADELQALIVGDAGELEL